MRIALLGTGIMGAPMARHIASAGHDVVAWNRTREKAEGIDGATVAGTPADAVTGALSNEPPVALKLVAKRRRPRAAPRKAVAAVAG